MNSNTDGHTHAFQAEVAQLLDLVVHSLYTDKEIFVRELISNASDALEKLRYLSLTEKELLEPDKPLEIHIKLDEQAGTFIIQDSGIGMTREEAIANLGTIAHSGSREFLMQVADHKSSGAELIGQFGVGFYSAFMVASEVTVESRSWKPDSTGIIWSSDGKGSFSIDEKDGLERGSRITLKLHETEKEFAKVDRIRQLIRHYSSFVAFPIFVNDEKTSTVQALWTKAPSEITDEQYTEFYRFVAGRADEPCYRLHFNADAPLSIHSILFVPGENIERFGMERAKPGVSLYCKKVLIQQHADKILPEYLRFIQGVVDSEDLPLNISRESMQDSALMNKLRRLLTKRILKLLNEQAESDPKKYNGFFAKFGMFIKEGVAGDFEQRDELAELLRFASSMKEDNELVSLSQYVANMKEHQKAIYYISGGNRKAIEAGPYLEALSKHGFEVLYCYEGIDDFVMTSLREYKDKRLISADQSDLELPEDSAPSEDALPEKDAGDLARWLKDILGNRINDVRASKRLVNSPAMLVNPNSVFTTGMQRILQAANQQSLGASGMILEINPAHRILQRLNEFRAKGTPDELAKIVTEQLLDNAMISAGLPVDPMQLVERGTQLIERALGDSMSNQ
jgi:TNF receptor-associated protein 1